MWIIRRGVTDPLRASCASVWRGVRENADMTTERWQKLTYWPLIVASFAFIVAYSWQVIAELRGAPRVVTSTVILVTWIMFVADYLVQLSLAPKKGPWFRAHLFALAVVVIPALKPLRLLRVLTLFHPFRRSACRAKAVSPARHPTLRGQAVRPSQFPSVPAIPPRPGGSSNG